MDDEKKTKHPFIERLYAIADNKDKDRAPLAAFKRGASDPENNMESMQYLYFPNDILNYEMNQYMTLATLFGISPTCTNDNKENLGVLLKRLSNSLGESGAPSLDLRVTQLVNCHPEDLPKLLVGLVRRVEGLIKDQNIGIDYYAMLDMIKYWNSDSNYQQKKLARDFWGYSREISEKDKEENKN